MTESLIMLSFCLLVGLISLLVCAWVLFSGQIATMDGILLILISLSVGGIFMANAAWSVYTGEFQEVLNFLRKKPKQDDGSGQAPPVSS